MKVYSGRYFGHFFFCCFIRVVVLWTPSFTSSSRESRILWTFPLSSPSPPGLSAASCRICRTVRDRSARRAASLPACCALSATRAVIRAALRTGRDSDSFSTTWALLIRTESRYLSTMVTSQRSPVREGDGHREMPRTTEEKRKATHQRELTCGVKVERIRRVTSGGHLQNKSHKQLPRDLKC